MFIFLPFKFNFLQTIAFLNWKNLKELNSLKHNLWDMDKQWNIYVHMKYNSIQFENDDLYFSSFRGLLENIYCYDIIKVWIFWFICVKKSSEIIIYTIEKLFQSFKQINLQKRISLEIMTKYIHKPYICIDIKRTCTIVIIWNDECMSKDYL